MKKLSYQMSPKLKDWKNPSLRYTGRLAIGRTRREDAYVYVGGHHSRLKHSKNVKFKPHLISKSLGVV